MEIVVFLMMGTIVLLVLRKFHNWWQKSSEQVKLLEMIVKNLEKINKNTCKEEKTDINKLTE